eukprot:NODE_604_length_6199_cov_0.403115.p2 type:complete len:510 gc:universal NODE_604_length_6199_cov_0.403115:118-1647(+)
MCPTKKLRVLNEVMSSSIDAQSKLFELSRIISTIQTSAIELDSTTTNIMTNAIKTQGQISELSQKLTCIQSDTQKEMAKLQAHGGELPFSNISKEQAIRQIPQQISRNMEEPYKLDRTHAFEALEKTRPRNINTLPRKNSDTNCIKTNNYCFPKNLESIPPNSRKSYEFQKNKKAKTEGLVFEIAVSCVNVFNKMPCGLIANEYCLFAADRDGGIRFWDFNEFMTTSKSREAYTSVKSKLRYSDCHALMNGYMGSDYVFVNGVTGSKETHNDDGKPYVKSVLVKVPDLGPSSPLCLDALDFSLGSENDILCCMGTECLPFKALVVADLKKNVSLIQYSHKGLNSEAHLHSEHTSSVNDLLWCNGYIYSCGTDSRIVGYDLKHNSVVSAHKLKKNSKKLNQIEEILGKKILARFVDSSEQFSIYDPLTGHSEQSFGISTIGSLTQKSDFCIFQNYCFLSDPQGLMYTWDLRYNTENFVDFGQTRIDKLAVCKDALITCGLDRSLQIRKIK